MNKNIKCVEVADDLKRFSLNEFTLKNNDLVKVTSTGKIYLVVNLEKLNSEEGYAEYTRYLEQTGGRVFGEITADGFNVGVNKVWHEGNFDPKKISPIQISENETHRFVSDEEKKAWNGKAEAKHGNHVPETQAKSDKTFLRNDNTWAVVTPENIGAQPKGNYAAKNHSHDYLSINGGTLNGNLTGKSDKSISGFGKVYNAVWNDYAEFFERGEETEPGDIIALDTNSDKERYIKATIHSDVIVGVHSDSFAHLIGGENPPDNEDFYEYNIKKFIPVGLAGRVKVKVVGSVKKGDYIILSDDIAGVGISLQEHMYEQGFLSSICIGRALENKDTKGIGLVKILIR